MEALHQECLAFPAKRSEYNIGWQASATTAKRCSSAIGG
jgi:hypothetical protein